MPTSDDKVQVLSDGWRGHLVGFVGLAALAAAALFASGLAIEQPHSDHASADAHFRKSLLGLAAYSAAAFFALRSPGRYIEIDSKRREIRIHDQWWPRVTPTASYQFREISHISTIETLSRSAGEGLDNSPSGYRPVLVLLSGKTIPVYRYRHYSKQEARSVAHAISELICEKAPT